MIYVRYNTVMLFSKSTVDDLVGPIRARGQIPERYHWLVSYHTSCRLLTWRGFSTKYGEEFVSLVLGEKGECDSGPQKLYLFKSYYIINVQRRWYCMSSETHNTRNIQLHFHVFPQNLVTLTINGSSPNKLTNNLFICLENRIFHM